MGFHVSRKELEYSSVSWHGNLSGTPWDIYFREGWIIMVTKFETIGGQVTEGETFAKLLEHLREAQDAAAVLGHLAQANDHALRGRGWLAVSEMLKLTIHNVTKLAMKKIH